jgi:hypothetical protein
MSKSLERVGAAIAEVLRQNGTHQKTEPYTKELYTTVSIDQAIQHLLVLRHHKQVLGRGGDKQPLTLSGDSPRGMVNVLYNLMIELDNYKYIWELCSGVAKLISRHNDYDLQRELLNCAVTPIKQERLHELMELCYTNGYLSRSDYVSLVKA